jgi:hypothetical protein
VTCVILQGRSQETSNSTGAAAGVCEETAEPTAALLEGLNEQVRAYAGSWRVLLDTSVCCCYACAMECIFLCCAGLSVYRTSSDVCARAAIVGLLR